MHTQPKPKKTKHGFLIVMLVTAVLGASCSLIYMDTIYGEGNIKAWFLSLAEEKPDASAAAPKESTPKDGEDAPAQQESALPEKEAVAPNDCIPLETDGPSYFAVFGKKILMCTKDGVQFLNSIGDQKWSDTFTMTTPSMIREGNFVAVGDMSGRTITVYNDVGKQYSIQAEGALVWFGLNKNGYLSVISNHDTYYEVMVYDSSGQQMKGRVEESPGVYPLSVDVSDDNTVFAVSYLDISDVTPVTKILFFYVGEVEQGDYTDSMFAAKSEEGQVIPVISFMKDNVLVAISDTKIDGFNIAGEKIWEIPFTNRVEQVDFENSNYTLISFGESLSGKDGIEPGTVWWINSAGKTTATFEAGGTVDYLKASEELVVIGSHNHFYGVKHNGRVLWECSGQGQVSDILMLDSDTKALYVTTQSAWIEDIQKKSKKEKSSVIVKMQEKEQESTSGDTEEIKEDQQKEQNLDTPTQDETEEPQSVE